MNILQINNCHYRRGGADVVYLDTCDLLERKGNEVLNFSTLSLENIDSKYEKYFVRSVNPLKTNILKQILVTPQKLYSYKAKWRLAKLLKAHRPEIAHIHLYKGGLTASILSVLKKEKIPTVITLHDFSLLCPRNLLFNGENEICEVCLTKSTINCIKRRCNRKNLLYSTISFSEFNFNNIFFSPERYFNKIISVSKFNLNKHIISKPDIKEKFVHLYNFTPALKESKPNSEKGDYFLFFGRISVEKGIHNLISTFQKCGFNLKVAGTGDLLEETNNFIKKNNIANIEMLGYKSGKELFKLISNSSFVVVPSICYENNPMTIIEAYSYGKPVIGSRIGGIPEIIVEEKTGYTFEMDDVEDFVSKVKLASSVKKEDYVEMSLHARKYAEENFSEDVHYKKLMEIYESIL